MIVMAFAIEPDVLRTIEHNRKFYPDRLSTPLFEHSMELMSQINFMFRAKCDRERGYRWRSEYESAYERDEDRAYDHISLMHAQVAEDWNREYTKEWNAGQARIREEMAG